MSIALGAVNRGLPAHSTEQMRFLEENEVEVVSFKKYMSDSLQEMFENGDH